MTMDRYIGNENFVKHSVMSILRLGFSLLLLGAQKHPGKYYRFVIMLASNVSCGKVKN